MAHGNRNRTDDLQKAENGSNGDVLSILLFPDYAFGTLRALALYTADSGALTCITGNNVLKKLFS